MMRRQHGFSLIELLISMVIGLVVIGAMMAAYLGTGASSRNTRALAQITEDASVALNVLRTTIGMTGYGTPTGIDPDDGMFTFSYPGATLRGCDSDFSDHDLDIGALTCGGDATSDAIAVAYEADAANSVVNADNEPLDCLGNSFDKDASGIWLAYQQFYVSGGSLTCRGPGNAAGQALVDNIETLQIRYGVGDRSVSRANQVVRYEDATTMSADDFKDAVSVRVCVLVRSEDQVMDSATAYRDCDGEQQEPEDDDRRMYRAFTSTIVLQNRLKGMR
jgi:type IV pilus assembly protein PilW